MNKSELVDAIAADSGLTLKIKASKAPKFTPGATLEEVVAGRRK